MSRTATKAAYRDGAARPEGARPAALLALISMLVPVAVVAIGAQAPSAAAVLRVSTVAAGVFHSCALDAAGVAYCWGDNSKGQIGDGTRTNRLTPVPIATGGMPAGTRFVSLAAGDDHTCGLATTGALYCWGSNTAGQLGAGFSGGDGYAPLAVSTAGLPAGTTWSSVAASQYNTCAVATTGVGYCWGNDVAGQIGAGINRFESAVPSPTRVAMSNVAGGRFTAISVGTFFGCGLTPAGAVYCWGSGSIGQLGGGALPTASSVPVSIDTSNLPSGVGFVGLASGPGHSCAVTTVNSVYCWGSDEGGQLGDGVLYGDRATPLPVAQGALPVGSVITAIDAGLSHTCVVTASGRSYCWGSGSSGQLGDGGSSVSTVPVEVSAGGLAAGESYAGVALGGYHTCAATNTGGIRCWGSNLFGEIGNGATDRSETPVPVPPAGTNPRTFATVSPGVEHTCGISTAGVTYCWGDNTQGQLGDGTLTSRQLPVPVDTSTLPAGTRFTSVSSGDYQTCALTAAGAAYCWGEGGPKKLASTAAAAFTRPAPVPMSGLPAGTAFASLATSQSHVCGLTTAQVLYCWGSNERGQLGVPGTETRTSPVAVPTTALLPGERFSAVDAGWWHTCALTTTGRILCWGDNFDGQLGIGPPTSRPPTPPTEVDTSALTAGARFTSVSASWRRTCALSSDGYPYCWGADPTRDLGDGLPLEDRLAPSRLVTAALPPGAAFTSVDIETQGCGLVTTGAVYCWGSGFAAGSGSTVTSGSPTPAPVAGFPAGTRFRLVTVGCAVTVLDALWCWGDNSSGKLGIGTTWSPTRVVLPGADQVRVLPSSDPGINALMTALAAAIPALEVVPVDAAGAAFSVPGCASGAVPRPRSDTDLLAMLSGAQYVAVTGAAVGPVPPDCRPQAVTTLQR